MALVALADMSDITEVNFDELASAFDDTGTKEIPILPCKSGQPNDFDEEFEKKKRKYYLVIFNGL